MHYTVDRRERFAQWVDGGFPALAVIEVNRQDRQVPAPLMLRRMRRCTDVLPSALAETIGNRLGLANGLRGRSYGEAARRLLASEATTTS
jgi:hypothetical protein